MFSNNGSFEIINALNKLFGEIVMYKSYWSNDFCRTELQRKERNLPYFEKAIIKENDPYVSSELIADIKDVFQNMESDSNYDVRESAKKICDKYINSILGGADKNIDEKFVNNTGFVNKEMLKSLAFIIFETKEDNEPELYLIPLILLDRVKNVKVYSISNEQIDCSEMDNDNRYGYLAYGFLGI